MNMKGHVRTFFAKVYQGNTSDTGFTLIELLVVIAILAILSTVIVVVINPGELLKQSRDTTRVSDLATINKTLGLLLVDQPNAPLGRANVVYVSIPDPSLSGTATSTCTSLGLPTLPPPYSYECHSRDTFRRIDGTGWIPVNFSQFSAGTILSRLPVDPVNATSTGLYYTYIPGGSWELNAILESQKYRQDSKMSKQNFPGVVAVGSDLNLSPLFNFTGLVGYWNFDEGSGTIAYDKSGNNNNGTLVNGPIWTQGKVGGALSFDGVDDYVTFMNSSSFINALRGDNTVSIWYYYNTNNPTTYQNLFNFDATDTTLGRERSSISYPSPNQAVFDYSGSDNIIKNYTYSTSPQAWHHFVVSINTNTMIAKIYHDGSFLANLTLSTKWFGNDSAKRIGYAYLSQYFNGLIDDVRIYNRALSDAEIQAIYNATK